MARELRTFKPEDYRRAERRVTAKDLERNMAAIKDFAEISFPGENLLAKNKSYLEEKDYLHFAYAAVSWKIKGIILFWSVGTLLLGLVLVFLGIFDPVKAWEEIFLGLVLLGFGGIFASYFFWTLPRRTASSYRRDDLRHMGQEGEEPFRIFYFFETGVVTGTSDGRHNKVLYSETYQIYETDRLFSFSFRPEAGYVMRKDSFLEGGVDAFINRMKKWTKVNQKKYRKEGGNSRQRFWFGDSPEEDNKEKK